MLYLQIFTTTLAFAVPPNATRRPHAEAEASEWRLDHRGWIGHQVRDCLLGPNKKRANLISDIGLAFSEVFRRVGTRRYPLHVTPRWRTVPARSMERNRWKLAPSPNIQRSSDASPRIFWPTASRKIGTLSSCERKSDLWHTVRMRRMERNRWRLVSSPDIQRSGDASLRIFWPTASRKIDRARRIWQRANTIGDGSCAPNSIG